MKEMNYAFSSENGQVTLISRQADPQASSWERFCLQHWQASQGAQ